jgi:hypothetical protein
MLQPPHAPIDPSVTAPTRARNEIPRALAFRGGHRRSGNSTIVRGPRQRPSMAEVAAKRAKPYRIMVCVLQPRAMLTRPAVSPLSVAHEAGQMSIVVGTPPSTGSTL